MGASGDTGTAGMCERGCVFNAGFAGFCAMFRRGEQGCGKQGFANRDVASGGVASGDDFFFKIVGLRKNKGVTLW